MPQVKRPRRRKPEVVVVEVDLNMVFDIAAEGEKNVDSILENAIDYIRTWLRDEPDRKAVAQQLGLKVKRIDAY